VRECLKDPKRTPQVKRLMEDGQKELGTQTYEQHLDELLESDQITEDTKRAALATANQPLMVPKRSKQA
jgi:Tfp pilus assembly pilus retraction ATPase PilT